jgi:hypothetical protein
MTYRFHILANAESIKVGIAIRYSDVTSEHFEGSCLTSAINSKQTETLTSSHS